MAKHETNSSNDERLFQIYKNLLGNAIFCDRDTRYAPSLIQEICKSKLDEAKIIMQVFNERNLNEPTDKQT